MTLTPGPRTPGLLALLATPARQRWARTSEYRAGLALAEAIIPGSKKVRAADEATYARTPTGLASGPVAARARYLLRPCVEQVVPERAGWRPPTARAGAPLYRPMPRARLQRHPLRLQDLCFLHRRGSLEGQGGSQPDKGSPQLDKYRSHHERRGPFAQRPSSLYQRRRSHGQRRPPLQQRLGSVAVRAPGHENERPPLEARCAPHTQ